MSFTTFTVECPSCTSRLRVQDPGLVGTISTCPRCGSMVQIIQPDSIASERSNERQIVAGEVVDSEAITEEAVPADDFENGVVGRSGFDDDGVAGQVPDKIPATLPTQWQSESTQRKRHIAFVATIAGAGLLVAVLAFGWFVKSWTASRELKIPRSVEHQSEASFPAAGSETTAPSTSDDSTVVDPDDENSIEQPNSPSEEPSSLEPSPSLITDATVTDSADGAPAPVTAPPTPPSSLFEPWRMDDETGAPSDGQVAGPDKTGVSGPAAISRREFPSSGGTATEGEGPHQDDRGKMRELPAELAEYTKLLDLASANFELKPTLETPKSIRDMKLDAPAEEQIDPMMVANPPAPISLKKALAIRLALDSPGYPLTDLTLVFSQITGVPIHLDWTSFDIAGRDIDQAINVPSGWMSAGELIDAIAMSVDAEARREDSLIQLTLSDPIFNAAYEPIVELTDFGSGADSAAETLVEFLQLDGDESPQAKLASIAGREDKQLASLAVEMLRRMRAIKPRIPDERLSRWVAKASKSPVQPEVSPGTWPMLQDIKSIPQVDAPTTIAAVLRETARINQATCLVNGYDSRRRGMSPEQMVMPYSGQSGEAMLAQTLAPFRMQVRQVDARHWWVGTEATYDRLPVLVWTEPLGEQRDLLLQRFQLVAEQEIGSDLRLVVDRESDRALLLIPRFLARQIDQFFADDVATAAK